MLNKQQIEKTFHLLCNADEAKAVGWEVVGMRAALMSHAFSAHFVLKSREDAQRALKLTDEQWIDHGNLILAYWQESEASGLLQITPPKPASRTRARKAGADNFAASRFGEALPLVTMQNGPVKVAELPGEALARTTQEMFDVVWSAYPNKTNKPYAFNCFKRLNATTDDVRAILNDVTLRAYTKKWSDGGGTYIPNPSTYLNNKVWTEAIVLTPIELAASTFPENERTAFFGKSRREIDSWIGSQTLLGGIPTQAQLEARLGLSGHRTSAADGEVIDAVVTEVSVTSTARLEAASSEVGQGNASLMLPAVPNRVLDPFEAEFMNALQSVEDPLKRDRIMSKDAKGKREWLSAWKTMRASGYGRAMPAIRKPIHVGESRVADLNPPVNRSQGVRRHSRVGEAEAVEVVVGTDAKTAAVAKSEPARPVRQPNPFESETWF